MTNQPTDRWLDRIIAVPLPTNGRYANNFNQEADLASARQRLQDLGEEAKRAFSSRYDFKMANWGRYLHIFSISISNPFSRPFTNSLTHRLTHSLKLPRISLHWTSEQIKKLNDCEVK